MDTKSSKESGVFSVEQSNQLWFLSAGKDWLCPEFLWSMMQEALCHFTKQWEPICIASPTGTISCNGDMSMDIFTLVINSFPCKYRHNEPPPDTMKQKIGRGILTGGKEPPPPPRIDNDSKPVRFFCLLFPADLYLFSIFSIKWFFFPFCITGYLLH